jgi:hypothetical protein
MNENNLPLELRQYMKEFLGSKELYSIKNRNKLRNLEKELEGKIYDLKMIEFRKKQLKLDIKKIKQNIKNMRNKMN